MRSYSMFYSGLISLQGSYHVITWSDGEGVILGAGDEIWLVITNKVVWVARTDLPTDQIYNDVVGFVDALISKSARVDGTTAH